MVRERLGRGLAARPARDAAARPRARRLGGGGEGGALARRALAERHPELEVVVSCTTNTGLEVARKLFPAHLVVRFPRTCRGRRALPRPSIRSS
jgi:hypothetical protein